MHNVEIRHVVILGGGSAGWLTAGVLAAEHCANSPEGIKITLIESPEVGAIGVGEGTWPSMRSTLMKMGVSETDLFRECEASFKQGAKFVNWITGQDDSYFHPLMLPQGLGGIDLVQPWLKTWRGKKTFGDTVCCQGAVADAGLAPKQITTPEYASITNYAYHLNSTKLGMFLQKHCVEKLGVNHIVDHVIGVRSTQDGDIEALTTKKNGDINGDLFIDCSGVSSLLLGKHFGIPFVDKKDILFNDTALAVQVPYEHADSPIASYTISTAQSAGWIWDIGLPTRKGVGIVYSSSHISEEQAGAELRSYIKMSLDDKRTNELEFRKIYIQPGHRQVFWHKNCVAVGMAAGFIEPLEASALVLVESAAETISSNLPKSRHTMDAVAKKFNQKFQHYWDTIVDFLKLHYVLSKRRDTDYWRDHTNPDLMSDQLKEKLALWKEQAPNRFDFPLLEEIFSLSNWQYVLYGMEFETETRNTISKSTDIEKAQQYFNEVQQFTQKALNGLPSNRVLIEKIHQFGLQKL